MTCTDSYTRNLVFNVITGVKGLHQSCGFTFLLEFSTSRPAHLNNPGQESIFFFFLLFMPQAKPQGVMADEGVVRTLRMHLESIHCTIYISFSLPKKAI